MSQLVCKYVVQYHRSYLTKKDTGAFTLWVSLFQFNEIKDNSRHNRHLMIIV